MAVTNWTTTSADTWDYSPRTFGARNYVSAPNPAELNMSFGDPRVGAHDTQLNNHETRLNELLSRLYVLELGFHELRYRFCKEFFEAAAKLLCERFNLEYDPAEDEEFVQELLRLIDANPTV